MRITLRTRRTIGLLACLAMAIILTGCISTPSPNPSSGDGSTAASGSSSSASGGETSGTDNSGTDTGESAANGTTSSRTQSGSSTSESSKPSSNSSQPPEGVSGALLKVLNNNPLNTGFLGFNAIYHAFPYMPDKYGRQYTEAQAKLELDRLAAMGINTVRSHYTSEWAWDAAKNKWDWDSPKMTGFWRCLSELQDRNIDIGLAALWSLASLETDGAAIPSPGIYVPNDLDKTMKNYGDFMVETLKQAKARGYNNIKYLFMFTEPHNTHLNKTTWQPDNPRSFALYSKAVRALDKALRDAGIRQQYKLVGPNDNVADPYSYFLDHAVKDLNDCIDIYANHASYAKADDLFLDSYHAQMMERYPSRLELIKDTGKPFWIDEINVSVYRATVAGQIASNPWSATQLAAIYTASMNLGIQNLFIWTVCDQLWPDNVTTSSDGFTNGLQKLGALPSLFESSVPRPMYYGLSLLTKYTGKGTTYKGVSQEDGVYIASIQRSDGNWTVIVTNAGYFEVDFTVEFEKTIQKTLYRHVYNPNTVKPTTAARIHPSDKTFNNVRLRFSDTIGGGEIAVYTSVAN